MRRYIIALMMLLSPFALISQKYVPVTKYDWTKVANTITKGSTNDYERVKAIYKWICANISYDTNYKIYRADECWDNKRGVCQAYCELFYHIAKAADIRVDIISGHSKDIGRNMGNHAWIYAETNKVKSSGILIDPTWGAGSVNDGVFKRNNNDMSWFHVSPYMMVFTHHPKESQYQLLESPVSYEDFLKLPPLYPETAMFGFNEKSLFKHCSNPSSTLPEFYTNEGNVPFYIEEIPLQSTLRTGGTYRFAVRKKSANFAILCGKEYIRDSEWVYRNGVYTLDYTVPCGNELKLSWYNEQDNLYHAAIMYKIPPATTADLRNLEKKRVFSMPEIKQLKGINSHYLKDMGFDGNKLLRAIRNGSVTRLPALYEKDAGEVVNVPLNGTLKAGKEYLFKIRPKRNGKWAIINETEWHREWTTSPDGTEIEITITPKPGTLKVSIQYGAKGDYYTYLMYDVK